MTYRPFWLSEGYEDLLAELDARAGEPLDFDVAIVGSGYGGAVAAARLAGATENGRALRVAVLERGREYVPGAFPSNFAELPGHVRFSRGDDPGAKGQRDGLYDFRIGKEVSALVGSGLGGGSLINAGVAERPAEDVFDDPAWPAALRRDRDGLRDCYARAEAMLETRAAPARDFAKYREFAALGRRLGVPPARPATVAVHFDDARNAQDVRQKGCIKCGDCVTGCNFWAKNTLPMNYLARARRCGAQLYTNVRVSHLSRSAGQKGWLVWICPTAEQHPAPGLRAVRAAHVILAAGSFGSTEILMRSRSSDLRFSARLGEKFSTNGDMISVLYGQRERVNAAPSESTAFGERDTGPTITGVIQTRGPRADRVVIEELAIPGALRRVFEEIITSGALPAQLSRFDWSCHAARGQDPIAVDPQKVGGSQIFAAMGDDGAAGRLEMIAGWEKSQTDGAICVAWPEAGKCEIFRKQDELLARSSSPARPELYLCNPLWRPLPEEFADVFSGPKPSGKFFTVHPLGGCPMGDDAEAGVVDDLGRVFDPADREDPQRRGDIARTHDGILVLDGSIVPAALGINPLLTIAALAERGIAGYAALCGWVLAAREAKPVAPLPPLPAGIRAPDDELPAPPRPAVTALRLAETMSSKLAGDAKQPRLTLDVVFGTIRDIPGFLREGPHEVPIESATLTVQEEGRSAACAALTGSVFWMERGRTGFLARTLGVFFTWIRLRGLADWFQRWREQGLWRALKLLIKGRNALKICSNAGEVRYLRYDLKLKDDLRIGDKVFARGDRIQGLKTFRYAGGGNPWRQLSELAVTAHSGSGRHDLGTLEVDFEKFFRRFAVQLQLAEQRDQPSAMMDLASIALFMARVVFKVHFWSFRLPEYEKYDPERARRRLPQELEGLEMRRHDARVAGAQGPLVLPLTRYWTRGKQPARPVLLLHGFGASGAQFAHAKLPNNLVRHLAREGRDVWVAELRTSISLPSSFNQWTLDQVATEDVPAIVKRILQETGEQKLDVVAHCIGSAMFCTAVLDGRLQGKVRSAVLLQVGPLITLSRGNVVRGRMAAALRRYMLTDHVDSSVDARADWLNALIDRVLATYPYEDEEARRHLLCPPWKARTHIANCNRSAAVFGRLFQHANVDDATLDLLGDLLGHTNLTTFEQTVHYAFLERLTDYDGINVYVSDENVRRYFDFPVRFLHGEKNDVFDPRTTERSARLLAEVFGSESAASRELIPGFGHLDPLIGKDAHRVVFPKISEFLDKAKPGPQAGIDAAIARDKDVKKPLIGPLLGWVRQDPQSGQRKARIWCRTDDEQSFGYFLVAVVRNGRGAEVGTYKTALIRLKSPDRKDPNASAVPMRDEIGEVDQIGVIDVPLPAEDDDYEIVIVSAHAATPSNLLPAAQQAVHAGIVRKIPLLDAKEFGYDALRNSRPRQTDPLPGQYGQTVLALRARWDKDLAEGRQARKVSDPGYEKGPDSVLVSRRLLERLRPGREAISFGLASCRYPATRVDREIADASFGRLRELLERTVRDPEGPALLLLAGDQIYADATAGMFDPKGRRERFYDAYREVWTAPNAREVLRRIPTYMMLDDHEVDDNWHPADESRHHAREWGLTAFLEYQLSHSPRGDEPAADPYHYTFEAGGFGFFACDTRTEREGRARIMSAPQLRALEEWLAARKDSERPKFVISPSVVVPFLRETGGLQRYAPRSDGWDGFRESLRELIGFIAQHRIRNIVFLCGDPHLSMASRMRIDCDDGTPLAAACVVASPMYAPYPFANADPREFLESLERGRMARLSYALQPFEDGSICVAGDSFSTVSVRRTGSRWQLRTEVHLREGATRAATLDLD